MWIICRYGYFSVVKDPENKGNVLVRGRVYQDLQQLRDTYIPDAGDIKNKAGTDYPFYYSVRQDAWAEALNEIAMDIDYTDFKKTITDEAGAGRANIYAGVWQELFRLQRSEWM